MDKNVVKDKIETLVSQLTLDEKITMIHAAGLFRTGGVERLGIPPLKTSDGPMGVRMEFVNDQWRGACTTEDYATYMPSNSALASTWNTKLAYSAGQVLGEEARGRGKDVILAPGINIKRSPMCGRNFEYMSEDPKVVEELAVPFIEGVQEFDVAACVKHFAANSQETDRLMVDTIIDERTLREIYLPGFKAAVQKAKSHSIMGAYNKLNGAHCCENKDLLGDILRKEWNYDGAIISDWGGVHKTKEAAESPLDVEMSVTPDFDDYCFANPLKEAIQKGEIAESLIDEKVRNILRMMFRLKMIGEEKEDRKAGTYNSPAHREAVYKVAAESIILLKNDKQILPLAKKGLKKLGVIGNNAAKIHSNGGGSAEIKALYEISPLMGIQTRLGGNTEVIYEKGYYVPEKDMSAEANWQEGSLDAELTEADKQAREEAAKLVSVQKNKELLEAAVALAKECEQVIFIGGLDHDYDVEGMDRPDMKLPYEQDKVLEAVLAVNPNTIVVMVAGSPVEMPWKDKVHTLVWSYYAGMETGSAIADVLFGNVNPSAKLSETFPVSYADTPTAENGQFALKDKVEHQEGIYVGYRYYEKQKKKPSFCFGYGLSYTTFAYSDLQITLEESDKSVKAQVSFAVENTGKVAGAEAAQVYVADIEASVDRPLKELKGFTKIFLQPGEKRTATVALEIDAFGFYSTEEKSFIAEAGQFEILVGASSEKILLADTVTLLKKHHYN